MIVSRPALQRRSVAIACGRQPFDGNVEIAHYAEMRIQPFQFAPYLRQLAVSYHRREENDRRAQARQCNAHSVQCCGIALACCGLICR
jgi:hypothetical protein